MSYRILYDGHNLGLRRGTGIAMYTRALVHLARDLGHRTGILFSRNSRLPRDELEREVAFFDADMSSSRLQRLRAMLTLDGHLTSALGISAQKVATGAVLTEPLGTSWVQCDDVYSARRPFDRARVLFTVTGQFLKVRIPEPVDLFHWTSPLPVRSNARANIYTVHDIIPLRLPYTTLDKKRFYLRSMRKLLAKADHVVTVSEHTKRDIVKYFRIGEDRITNTYETALISPRIIERSSDDIANEVAGSFGLQFRNYFLFYGSFEPKKNIGRILRAYATSNIQMPIVFVFAQSWLGEDDSRLIDQVIQEHRIDPDRSKRRRIRRYEYLPFPLLATLIQGARAVVFPSIYEGFGLPVLESMMLGTPVITSTASAIPEVAGDAAIMVDPYDVDAMAKAIKTLGSDSDMCAELSTRGLRRAELFSMDRYRERMQKVYDRFL
jgi:glycosyltransferase involved in cell wall biosynthesis